MRFVVFAAVVAVSVGIGGSVSPQWADSCRIQCLSTPSLHQYRLGNRIQIPYECWLWFKDRFFKLNKQVDQYWSEVCGKI